MEALADAPWGGVEDEDASPLLLGTLRRDGSFCTHTNLLHNSRHKGALKDRTGPTFRDMDTSGLDKSSSSSETRMGSQERT